MITAAWVRSSTRRILPVAVVGYSVTKTIRRGRLKDGKYPAELDQRVLVAGSRPG
jgi:hypothetical protein